MASPTSLDGGYVDERFTSASFGSDCLPVPSMQHLFGSGRCSSAGTSQTVISAPYNSNTQTSTEADDEIAGGQSCSSDGRSAYCLSSLNLSQKVQCIQTNLHDLGIGYNDFVRYYQADRAKSSSAMYDLRRDVSTLERSIANLHLEGRLDAQVGVNLNRIEAQKQRSSLVIDSLHRQINALQCELAGIKQRTEQSSRIQPTSEKDDVEFVRTCLLNAHLSHADRYAAVEILARMQRGGEV